MLARVKALLRRANNSR